MVELAWLQSAFGIGFVAGGITLSAWGGFKRRIVTGLVALMMFGAGSAVIGLVPANAFPLAVGDIVTALFNEWSIDYFRQQGKEVEPIDLRRHNMAAAVALPGGPRAARRLRYRR